MAISLNHLSAMLDEHFRLAPPLDSPAIPVSGAIREFGDGVSLGDGTSMADVRGLENIQVVEKANSFDKVRQISMKDWMEKTIRENPNPEAVAASVSKLLENGQMTYFEQGREFANQLRLDPETKELYPAIVAREARPPVKPTLTFFQKFKRLFNWLPQDELDNYNRDLLSYEVQKKSLAASKIRVEISEATVPEYDDKKGKILVIGDHEMEISRNIALRRNLSQLSPEMRSVVESNILSGANKEEPADLKIGSKLNEKKFFEQRYPFGKPGNISSIEDHVKYIVKWQESIKEIAFLKNPKITSMLANNNSLCKNFLNDALLIAMNGGRKTFDLKEKLLLMESDACKSMLEMKGGVLGLAKRNQIFDQFAKNLENNPIKGITPKQIENLLDICIEPHNGLSTALKASKNPEMLKAANNKHNDKQNDKQMGKEAPKMKASVPKMG